MGFTTAAWVFWALIFNETADTADLYLNGSLVSSAAHSGTYLAADGNIEIGASGTTTNFFAGKMAHSAVFESGLHPTNDIAALYALATA